MSRFARVVRVARECVRGVVTAFTAVPVHCVSSVARAAAAARTSQSHAPLSCPLCVVDTKTVDTLQTITRLS